MRLRDLNGGLQVAAAVGGGCALGGGELQHLGDLRPGGADAQNGLGPLDKLMRTSR